MARARLRAIIAEYLRAWYLYLVEESKAYAEDMLRWLEQPEYPWNLSHPGTKFHIVTLFRHECPLVLSGY